MADIFFYHLTSTSLDHALPKLLEKALQGGFRSLVRVAEPQEAERLCGWLWNYNLDSFLPHGTAKDGFSGQQPIFITADDENPNSANLLVTTCGALPAMLEGYQRILDIFNGEDAALVEGARNRWKQYLAEGHTLTYFRQNASGAWEKNTT